MMKLKKMTNNTLNGSVFTCNDCNKIHVEYINFNLSFTEMEYKHFKKYILKLNGELIEILNKNSRYKRKIHVSLNNNAFSLLFNSQELLQLKLLLKENIKSTRKLNNIKTLNKQCLN